MCLPVTMADIPAPSGWCLPPFLHCCRSICLSSPVCWVCPVVVCGSCLLCMVAPIVLSRFVVKTALAIYISRLVQTDLYLYVYPSVKLMHCLPEINYFTVYCLLSKDDQAGRLVLVYGRPRVSGLAKGTIRLKTTKTRWSSWWPDGGWSLWTKAELKGYILVVEARILKWEFTNNSKQPKSLIKKQAEWQPNQICLHLFNPRVNFLSLMKLMQEELLSMKMLTSKNQSSLSQVHVPEILGTKEFLFWTQNK